MNTKPYTISVTFEYILCMYSMYNTIYNTNLNWKVLKEIILYI